MIKIFQFNWDSEYGSGLLVVGATSQESAEEYAKLQDKRWSFDSEVKDLAYTGEADYKPFVIFESHYQE